MKYVAGPDVSLDETAVCIVEACGEIVREFWVASEPEALITALRKLDLPPERIGLEACSPRSCARAGTGRSRQDPALPPWPIAPGVQAHGAEPDAPNSKQIGRELCARDPARSRRQARHAEAQGFADRVRAWAGDDPTVELAEPLPSILAAMSERRAPLTKWVQGIARNDGVRRLPTSTAGVGPITALAFRTTIDHPNRFRRSRDAGAHLGLTPARYRSGETDIQGKASRWGDELARTALHEAAHRLPVRRRTWSVLRVWGLKIAKRRGLAKARKLALILHRMRRDGAAFHFGKRPNPAAA